jgi:GT2 family glycosyltransferase
MSKRNRRNRQPMAGARKAEVSIDKSLIDIIIPVYNRFDILEECLDAIPEAANGVSYNVICVDNNSSLAERDKFYSSRDDIILIQNRENFGFPRACNIGAKRKSSPILFFLNSDVILQPTAIEKMVMNLDDPQVGVVGALLQFPEYARDLNPNIRPANKVQHVGMETNIHGKWIHVLLGWSVDNPKVLARKDTYAVTGAALMTRRSLWNKIGGFFEGYGLGTFEDVDFCVGIRDIGYNIVVETGAVGTHFTGATAEKERIQYPMDYNRFVFLQRWSQKLMWTEWNAW